MSRAESVRYIDVLKYGVTATMSISLSLADFKQDNIVKRQQNTTKHNMFRSFHGVSVLSTDYRLVAKQRCVFGLAEAPSTSGHGARIRYRDRQSPHSVPRAIRLRGAVATEKKKKKKKFDAA